jgi:[protein-PII] uridylyltransferase
VWSPWKQTLLAELGRRCRSAMAGERLARPPSEPVAPELVAGVAAGGRPQVRYTGREPVTVLIVVADGPGVLSAAAGVLALHSLEVHAAELETATGLADPPDGEVPPPVAVLRFTVSPRFGGLPDPTLLRAELGRVLDGSLPLGEALARKERDYAPVLPPGEVPAPARVLWFDDEATGGVVLELRATDRIGMLHRVAQALEGCDAQVQWARVATLGSSVVDSFGIRCRREGGPTAERRREMETAVLAAAR